MDPEDAISYIAAFWDAVVSATVENGTYRPSKPTHFTAIECEEAMRMFRALVGRDITQPELDECYPMQIR